MFYTYILFSKKDKKFYYGYTSNLKNRFLEHESGAVEATKYRRPLVLVHYEAFLNAGDAIAQEKYFKSAQGRKYLQRHLKHTFAAVAQW
jgi:putative endonuclease